MDKTDWDKTDLATLNALGLPNHLLFAVLEGKISQDEAVAQCKFDRRVTELRRTPVSKWPTPTIAWDLSSEYWHMALDGYSTEDFARDYPNVIVGWADLTDLQKALIEGSRRIHGPFHSTYKSKTSKLVLHLSEGGVVSPPMIKPTPQGLVIVGGNHRLGWAVHMNETDVPLLVEAADIAKVESILTLRL